MSQNLFEILLPFALNQSFTYASNLNLEIGDVAKFNLVKRNWELFGKKRLPKKRIFKLKKF